MNNIRKLFFLLFVLYFPVAAAGNVLLEKFHGDMLEECKLKNMCTKVNQNRCISMYKRAFSQCDQIFLKNPKTTTPFSDCISNAIYKELSDIMMGIDFEKCDSMSIPDKPYKSEASRPVDNPMVPEYFTINSLDFSNVRVYGSKEEACRLGASRARELIEQGKPVKVEINITRIESDKMVDREGDPGYSHIFSTPAYEVGRCLGNAKTTMLKAYSPFRKGEVIESEYEDRLFVTVQCHKEPRHSICKKAGP